MKIIIFLSLVCLLSPALLSTEITPQDPLAADDMAAKYRTGKIDPAIAEIPGEIRSNIFIDPKKYLKKLVDFLSRDADNDYHIVKRIHDWITDSIAYQFNTSTSIYKFLKTKKTNCTGYSYLFREMTGFAGIPAKLVVGYSKTYRFSSGKQGNHAWNIVTIDGKQYIVDITHNKRQRVHGDSFGEKSPYTDTELFILPEYKLLLNLPYSKSHQLVKKPISYEEYMKSPRKRLGFIKYGLEFANPHFSDTIIEAEYKWPSGLTGIFDGIKTRGVRQRLTMQCPQDVELKIQVGNFGESYPDNAHQYRRGKHVVFLFSAPGQDSSMVTISARYKGGENWERAYTFVIVEESIAPGHL